MEAATLNYLQRLQAHKGGLLCLKAELYWYGGRGRDGTPGRICLILDAAIIASAPASATTATAAYYASAAAAATAALLLIDGSPQWIWVVEADVELL